jgi:cell division septum initiation protein DivIVA
VKRLNSLAPELARIENHIKNLNETVDNLTATIAKKRDDLRVANEALSAAQEAAEKTAADATAAAEGIVAAAHSQAEQIIQSAEGAVVQIAEVAAAAKRKLDARS